MDLQAIFGDRPVAKPNQSPASDGSTAASPQAVAAGPEAWDSDEAVRLIVEADNWFSRLGVSGAHPSLQAAADRVLQAALRRSMPQLRQALRQFREVAERLQAESTRT